ncbi:helix-turn-helix domain-containing protein [Pleomorphochaeta sp. DL1XJH-081]|jgi:DNA-binding CsgD family transcriptional regulator|uniref:helix-turn-helix domain-containing protein n=1 Tax=Pleomorphochaeta sp. DL1XJH-081 TaxID=3409690 RepID=UPI003BB69466
MLGQGLTILLYMFAFATGCMTLVLSVVFHIRESYQWTKYFIIFHASLLLVIVLQVLKVFVDVFLGDTVASVTGIVVQSLLAANVSFLILFVPYFTTWIIAQPWRNPYRIIFSFLAIAYMSLSVLHIIFNSIWVFQMSMMLVFVGTLFFCIGVILKNLKTIVQHDVRIVSKSIIILSFVMIPLLIISLIFPQWRYITYPIYFMAFSIILLVFLFIYFKRMPHEVQHELTYDKVGKYHITEREFSVILLIREGLTNKEIAGHLDISVNTVNNHVANIFSKTKVRSRIDLLNNLNKD